MHAERDALREWNKSAQRDYERLRDALNALGHTEWEDTVTFVCEMLLENARLRDEQYTDLLDQMQEAWGPETYGDVGRCEVRAFLQSRIVHMPTTSLRAERDALKEKLAAFEGMLDTIHVAVANMKIQRERLGAERDALKAENARLREQLASEGECGCGRCLSQDADAEREKLRGLLDVIGDAEPEWRESAVWREALGEKEASDE